jgi:hypothetical protein
MLPVSQSKKKQTTYQNDNILESVRGIGVNVGKTISQDVISRGAGDALQSLFGTPKSGELHQNQPIEFTQKEENPREPQQEVRHTQPEQPAIGKSEDAQAVQAQLNAVRTELKALIASLNNLQVEMQKTIEETPVDPGVYHVNFFEKLRTLILILKQQVDDGRNWLALTSGRKKKQNYWGMYKKHGTQFGLSNERKMSTQAG